MTIKNGLYTFECDKDIKGDEFANSSQRNNNFVWPPVDKYQNAQYRTTWMNMCNFTSYAMAARYTGYIIPTGPYEQDEDNFADFFFNSQEVMDYYKRVFPSQYNAYEKSIKGECTKQELDNVLIFPNELHDVLCFGFNKWISTVNNADFVPCIFRTNVDFPKLLWDSMVKDDLPIIVSTKFGGFAGHIVCVTGVQYSKRIYETITKDESLVSLRNGKGQLEYAPESIIIDDPWGKYNPVTNKYDAPNGGNDIIVPWDRVVSTIKPCGSDKNKWAHIFNKNGIPTV